VCHELIKINSIDCDRRSPIDHPERKDFFYCYEVSKECLEINCPKKFSSEEEEILKMLHNGRAVREHRQLNDQLPKWLRDLKKEEK
jgi:hypothetical protein